MRLSFSRSIQLSAVSLTFRQSHSKFTKMDADLVKYYDTVLCLTKKAGDLIVEKVSQKKHIDTKASEIDLVTETDKAVEKLLISGLSDEFPTHKFIGEESVDGKLELTKEPTWVIDPIDGTMNFVHSFPHSCISIALFMECEPVIGIIYNPMLQQLFSARKGQGAFLNGKRMQVSSEIKLGNSLLMMENGSSRDPEKIKSVFENAQKLIPKAHGTRSLGSAALNMAMVALGCAEAYFEFGVHIWDIGAGELLVREAGGVIMDPAGGPVDYMSRRMLCANNKTIADQMMPLLTQYYPPRD